MDQAGDNDAAGAGAGAAHRSFDPRFAGATREELNMLRYVDPAAPSDTGATLALEVRAVPVARGSVCMLTGDGGDWVAEACAVRRGAARASALAQAINVLTRACTCVACS